MNARALAPTAQRLRRTFDQFTPGQKAVTVLAVAGALIGAVLFTSWAGKPSYAPAFTNLSATDASAITQKLTSSKIPYRLTDGGQTVEVPQSQVYQTRITLAGAGLPGGSTSGYSLLDKQGLTTSDFQQHVTYQRALEGELAKTIEAIDGVDAAVVHLVVPTQDVFAEDTTKPSASVLVKSTPGTQMTPGQVQAIVHLVASSVQGLTTDQVTVASADGTVLNAPGTDGTSTIAADQHTQQTKDYENSTAQAVQTMLDNIVGTGHAVVRVQADLNYDRTSTTTQRYITDKSVPPITDTTTTESYKGSGGGVAGVLGPDNNGVPAGGSGKTTYTKTSDQRNNAVGQVTQQVDSAAGQVRRQSVAVVLDARAAKSLNPTQVSQLVSAAAGIVPSRGDTVQVSMMSFDTSAAAASKKELAAAAAAKRQSTLLSLAKTLGIVVLVLFVLFFLMRRSRRVEEVPLESLLGRAQLTRADVRDELEAADHGALLGTPQPLALDASPSEEERRRTQVRSDVATLIDQQPDEMAKLLHGWLADRRS